MTSTDNPPRVHIATDHAGMELSAHLVQHLNGLGHEVIDHWPRIYDAQDDYPPFCTRSALAVVADQQAGTKALGATGCVDAFLKEPFSGDERHRRRIGEIVAEPAQAQALWC